MRSIRLPASLFAMLVAAPAMAKGLPEIRISAANHVPECATPGRLMSFVEGRNGKLDHKFSGIATEYMRHGEQLGLRWDIAFFQMLVETGNLSFTGVVKPSQNNFAGLGATGGRERGESFKSVSTGVRAHLEHLLMYAGQHIDNPVAERTRKVQEWGVLTKWQKSIKGPMTFTQLTKQWAPGSGGYRRDIESVTEAFYDDVCKTSDPHPEMVAEARGGTATLASAASVASPPAPAAGDTGDKDTGDKDTGDKDTGDKISGAELARRSVAEARAEGQGRSSLGAAAIAKAEPAAETAASPVFKVINGGAAETGSIPQSGATPASAGQSQSAQAAAPAASAPAPDKKIEVALAAEAARAAAPAVAPKAAGKCHVWTASYGGQKAIIIKAITTESTNYTVLDVNEGAEKREADAYIAAYAKGGEVVGHFGNQNQALEKAFDLCPEG